MGQSVIGGWSGWSFTPTKEATKVFEETLGKMIGVKYKMVAFATQLVNGTNYAFVCEAETVTIAGMDYIALASVYQPIKGQPHVNNIKPIGPRPTAAFGGWQNWQFSVTGRAATAFAEATKGWIGVKYQALAVTQQLVSGMNYCYLCEATPVTVVTTPSPAFVWVYQPLQGAAHITHIQTISPAEIHALQPELAD